MASKPYNVQDFANTLDSHVVRSVNANEDMQREVRQSINSVAREILLPKPAMPIHPSRKRRVKLTEEECQLIKFMSSHGNKAEDIASTLQIGLSTLYRRYGSYMEDGRRILRAMILRAQFKVAVVDENPNMLIHLGKVHCDQNQSVEVNLHAEVTGQVRHDFTQFTDEQLASELRKTRSRILETDAILGTLVEAAPENKPDAGGEGGATPAGSGVDEAAPSAPGETQPT